MIAAWRRGRIRPARDGEAVEIVEFTDPFCSWAWSTEPKLRLLRAALGHGVRWRQVVGVLVDGAPERGISMRAWPTRSSDGKQSSRTRTRRCR